MNVASYHIASRKSLVREPSLFHEKWWLDAVAGSRWREAAVEENGVVVGRLPFMESRRLGLRILGMPSFTRTLGPWVSPGEGTLVNQRQREIRIISMLLAQLPKHHYFKQLLAPTWDNALAFKYAGFCVGVEHVIEIDCRDHMPRLFKEIHNKTRNLIRRAGQKQRPEPLEDPEEFLWVNNQGLTHAHKRRNFEARSFVDVFSACRERNAGMMLGTRDGNGRLTAAVFVVWSQDRMHLLLESRDRERVAPGAMELLTWQVMCKANERGLRLDLDGMSNEKLARRPLTFGGEVRQRFIVSGGSQAYLWNLRRALLWKFGNHNMFC